MSKPIIKEDVILHKKAAIKKLNALLENYINDSSNSHLKKANLISYWLESYSEYLYREETFNPRKLIAYKRGNIVKVDFGFNIGSEHGGLHYAVVLDTNNKQSSPVVTVIPLSSGTEDSTYERDVYLGKELYQKMLAKHQTLAESALEEWDKCNNILSALIGASGNKVQELISDLEHQQTSIEENLQLLGKYKQEIDNMKRGSIAMMEQITTISKMRIYVPRKSIDILYGISFSPSTMDKINDRLEELFLYRKR